MIAFTITAGVTFEPLTLTCCGFTVALPASVIEQRQRDHRIFWCPNCGKRRYFAVESDVERAERRAEVQYNMRVAAEDAAKASECRRRAEKAAKTKMKNRIANGVCPCCNRSFKSLHRHMQTKHPNWTE